MFKDIQLLTSLIDVSDYVRLHGKRLVRATLDERIDQLFAVLARRVFWRRGIARYLSVQFDLCHFIAYFVELLVRAILRRKAAERSDIWLD